MNILRLLPLLTLFALGACNFEGQRELGDQKSAPIALASTGENEFLLLNSAVWGDYDTGSLQLYQGDSSGPTLQKTSPVPTFGLAMETVQAKGTTYAAVYFGGLAEDAQVKVYAVSGSSLTEKAAIPVEAGLVLGGMQLVSHGNRVFISYVLNGLRGSIASYLLSYDIGRAALKRVTTYPGGVGASSGLPAPAMAQFISTGTDMLWVNIPDSSGIELLYARRFGQKLAYDTAGTDNGVSRVIEESQRGNFAGLVMENPGLTSFFTVRLSDAVDLKKDSFLNPLFKQDSAAENALTDYTADFSRFISLGNLCGATGETFAVGRGFYEKESGDKVVLAEALKSYSFSATALTTPDGDKNVDGVPLTAPIVFTPSAPLADYSKPARLQKIIKISSDGACQRHVHVLSEDRDLEKPDEKPTSLLSFKADGTASLFAWPNPKTSGVTHLSGDSFIGVDVFSGAFSTQTVP